MLPIKTYVIRTPNDPKREELILDSLFFQGVHPQSVEFVEAIMDAQMPSRGISRSHRKIIQEAFDQDLQEVCIIEDDVLFLTPKALEMFFIIYQKHLTKTDCDMFMAGIYDGEIGERFLGYIKVKNRISGLHCYIVRNKFYKQFLEADEAWNLDYDLSHNKKASIYCMWPFLAIQHDGYSYNARNKTTYNYNLHKKYQLYGR